MKTNQMCACFLSFTANIFQLPWWANIILGLTTPKRSSMKEQIDLLIFNRVLKEILMEF